MYRRRSGANRRRPRRFKRVLRWSLKCGDGLLGGPSCAVIAGKSTLVAQLAAHPLMRTTTCDKSITAALEATLELYQTAAEQQPSSIERAIPLLGLLATSADNLKHRCERLAPQLAASPAFAAVEPLTGLAHLTAAKLGSERLDTWGLASATRPGNRR